MTLKQCHLQKNKCKYCQKKRKKNSHGIVIPVNKLTNCEQKKWKQTNLILLNGKTEGEFSLKCKFIGFYRIILLLYYIHQAVSSSRNYLFFNSFKSVYFSKIVVSDSIFFFFNFSLKLNSFLFSFYCLASRCATSLCLLLP